MAKGSEQGKNPSVNWIFNDWHGGTSTMSRFVKGCYMDLLHAQFNNGHISLDEIKTVLGSDFGSSWPALQKKFVPDGNGLYYNKRLEFEIIKKRNYSNSRHENLSSNTEESSPHMGNGIGNGIEDESNKKRYEVFKEQCLTHERWQNDLCIACKIEMEDIPQIINEYIAHLGAGDVVHGTLKDFKQHIRNWLLAKPAAKNGIFRTPKILS